MTDTPNDNFTETEIYTVLDIYGFYGESIDNFVALLKTVHSMVPKVQQLVRAEDLTKKDHVGLLLGRRNSGDTGVLNDLYKTPGGDYVFVVLDSSICRLNYNEYVLMTDRSKLTS